MGREMIINDMFAELVAEEAGLRTVADPASMRSMLEAYCAASQCVGRPCGRVPCR
ncbi:MAG: hypothetical protein ACLVJO_02760 [[Clostridium] scindens]